jgi:hypothetical protein
MHIAYVLSILDGSVRRLVVERLLDLIKIIYNMENRLHTESSEDKRQLMGLEYCTCTVLAVLRM